MRIFGLLVVVCAVVGHEFGACPWDQPESPLYAIECATLPAPLDYEQPAGDQIPFHVTRLTPKAGPIIGQLWFLNGGPGTPGEWFLPFLTVPDPAGNALPFEIFLPDHRGTGLSSELSCPDGSQNLDQTCIDYWKQNSSLLHYTVTNAARDLNDAIQSWRVTGRPVYLFGTSYGTVWANRYMLLFPRGISGVIMESVVNPTEWNFAEYEVRAAAAAEAFIAKCDESAVCRNALGGSAVDSFRTVVRDIAAGTQSCVKQHFPFLNGKEGADRIKNEVIFRLLFQAGQYFDRLGLFGVIHRLQRCNSKDVDDLKHFITKNNLEVPSETPLPPGLPPFVRQSIVLNTIIQTSEGWWAKPSKYTHTYPTFENVEEWHKQSWLATGAVLGGARYTAMGFPKYQVDEHFAKVAEPSYPVLLINGDADLATPYADVESLHNLRPSWNLVRLPLFGHSPAGGIAAGLLCPLQLIASFTLNPQADLSSGTCADALPKSLDELLVQPQAADVPLAFFGQPVLFS